MQLQELDEEQSENEERQVRPRPNGRPTQPLRLGELIIRPVITKSCKGIANYTLAVHCAKYLSCGGRLFRGAIRTCKSGETFDHKTKKCNKSFLVDCKLM